MRVLQFAKFYPPERGGMESIVRELTVGLNAAGCPTDVLCAHRRWRSADERTEAGWRVVRAGVLGTWLSTSLSLSTLAWARRLLPEYDVVHVHMPNPLAALALWWARPACRVVVHWHSDVVNQQRALKLYEPLQRWLLTRADAIVATSPPYADHSPALYPWRGKVAVIPLGIGDNLKQPDPGRVATMRSSWPGKRIIFSLGRMASYKGFDTLIEAARSLPDDAVVVVGGAGPRLAAHRARVAALGLDKKVFFVGPVDEEDIPAYHEAADVFCMPSLTRAEAFGVAQLEAMRAGRPVVCSAIEGSGVAWVTVDGTTGLTAAPGSPDSLAAALNRLLQDASAAARMGAAGRARYLDHFTAGTMVAKIAALYVRITNP
ncbi:MAG: glycosyltransferase [Burkholderiaceae bacterium]